MISPSGGNRVAVRIFGNCHPNECDWGVVPAESYTADPQSGDVQTVTALIHFGFAHHRIVLRKGPGKDLSFEAFTQFADGSERHDFVLPGRLKPTDWSGPVGQGSWEAPVVRSAGWGGGPRGGVLLRPKEICDAFDPNRLELVPAGHGWMIEAGGKALLYTGWDQKTARRALDVIRHYRFDRKCHTGTVDFWKTGDSIPDEKIGGADCVRFGSTTAHVAHVGKSWQVVDGTTEVADLKTSKDNAFAVLALIRTYRLERKCVVAWPNPVITYWLSH
jgi:hypothetical protein